MCSATCISKDEINQWDIIFEALNNFFLKVQKFVLSSLDVFFLFQD